MNYLDIVFIIIFFINFYISFLNYLHIYQLNFYKVEAQQIWMGNNSAKILFLSFIYFFCLLIILFFDKGTLYVLIIYLLLFPLINPKKSKKPLVYTGRVKRMIGIVLILNILILLMSYLIYKNLLILPFISMINPYLIFIVDKINEPINKMINKKYINEAKNILAGMKDLTIIGITGSYGKTSMKTFLGELLSIKYNTLITPKNYNTTLGVVITIREYLRSTHEIFVCEMGATHVKDIKEICDLVHPNHAVITSIGPQHLETFKSMNNIIKTKFELVDSINNGKIFLNYDNEFVKKQKIKKDYITYGVNNKKTDYNAYDIKVTSKGLTFKMKDKKGKEYKFITMLIGKHNVLNLVGAISIALSFDIPMKKIVDKVREIEPVEHRLQFIPGNPRAIIDDAYNSNPVGAKNAIDALAEFKDLKILITPGMVELGEKEYELNYEFGEYAAKKCDYIILVGEKQTKAISDAIKKSEFDKDKLFIANTLDEALVIESKIEPSKERVVLLENDLPDQY